mgnify:CR=1 FL=1
MTTTDRQHTLASIAADANTTKRTVQRWLSKAGDIGGLQGDTRYFSDAERDTLLSYQSQRKANDTAPVDKTPVAPATVEIYQGNHQHTLANIDMNTSFDLSELRSPLVTVQSYQDPLAMAQQLIEQNQQIVGAMSVDLQQRQAKIDQTNHALTLIEQSNHNLMLQAQQYQIESRVQAAVLNQTTTQLQQKIAIQQSLGKPVGSSVEQSPS